MGLETNLYTVAAHFFRVPERSLRPLGVELRPKCMHFTQRLRSEVKSVTVGGHLPSEGLRQLQSQEAAGNVGKGTGRESGTEWPRGAVLGNTFYEGISDIYTEGNNNSVFMSSVSHSPDNPTNLPLF